MTINIFYIKEEIMITIAIELNHVVRNVNKPDFKSIIKKDIKPELDIDNIDEKDDVFKYAKFDSKKLQK